MNLDTFDDRPYDEIIAKLKGEGFQFTTMEALGNTQEAQRKLYLLNDTTARLPVLRAVTTPTTCIPGWISATTGASWRRRYLPTIAIYRELGYTQIPGIFSMEKMLK